MKKFICNVCGYIYDEAVGIPDRGIAPGTRLEELPSDWVCPLCGAPKSAFREKKEGPMAVVPEPAERTGDGDGDGADELRELSFGELSAICSNLAKGCEKQYLAEEIEGGAGRYGEYGRFVGNGFKGAGDGISSRGSGCWRERGPRCQESSCLEREGYQNAGILVGAFWKRTGSISGAYESLRLRHLRIYLHWRRGSGDMPRVQGTKLKNHGSTKEVSICMQ